MSKSKTVIAEEKSTLFSVRFLISLLLIVGGIAWLVFYYAQARGNPLAFPPVEGSPKAVADLGRWNYAIGFGVLMLGLIVSAHPSTPLGRGRGVVVGMLACFLIGLLWICTFYVFSDDLSSLWVFNDLGQWNLVVGIAFMAVGFSFATKWE
ncbi:cell division protein CrgA [Nocardioides astragali]|uniref:Cell division protein CrgA n=1 Tax=Nocardioides astragali TaxID=1776736 RepID=A0ABW2MVF2_9ACTN|nr:cell division protein CrgA [Nocardioides astragali]